MPIVLTEYERGAPFTGDYQSTLSALQDRLARAQLSQIVHRKRAIVLIEGWDGGGKRGALKKLAGAWDPCQLATHCLPVEGSGEGERHWLAP
ncbi:MAG: polyphosphate kinase, partial [Sphingomicrobium sp.]